MIIQNLNNGKILIKHETAVDPDNEFILEEELSKEAVLFDRFFKKALEAKRIFVQVAEIIDINTPFSTYFAPCKIWEDTETWKKWFKDFQDKHSICLYFYEGESRAKQIFDSTVDTIYSTHSTFNDDTLYTEEFKIKDYFLSENSISSAIEIHVHTDVIYECLKKSRITECKNLLKEFQYELLNETIGVNEATQRNKPKI